jgi:hypothetical protein
VPTGPVTSTIVAARSRRVTVCVTTRLVVVLPADLTALDRLARFAEINGQPALAGEFRSKRADVQRLRARYQQLYERKQPVRNAIELACLAEQLGRAFEARAFLTLAIAEYPEHAGPAAR